MNSRICTVFLLLLALLATRLLDVHFHLPPTSSSETPHLVAVALVEAHQHDGAPDHGHIASHLYEGEADEDAGTGLLAKLGSSAMVIAPVLLGLFLLLWRTDIVSRLSLTAFESPPRPRRWARQSPPSQAPPLLA